VGYASDVTWWRGGWGLVSRSNRGIIVTTHHHRLIERRVPAFKLEEEEDDDDDDDGKRPLRQYLDGSSAFIVSSRVVQDGVLVVLMMVAWG
jgi:hypothetical protein